MNVSSNAHPKTGFERRQWKRVPCDLDVVCGIKGGERKGRAVNISGGGIMVKMEDENCRPEKLYMTFVVPGSAGDREVKAIGNVVRTTGCGDNGRCTGLGVSFVVIQAEARQAIMNYVEGMSHTGS